MVLPVWAENLVSYSLQIAILSAAGTLLAYLFRLRVPRISLFYWQTLLIICLALPALQSWRNPVLQPAVSAPAPVRYVSPERAGGEVISKFSITPQSIAFLLGVGISLRLIWLALGFVRLRRIVGRSRPLTGVIPAAFSKASRIGVYVRFCLSEEVDSPATFGFFSPMVILPQTFLDMDEDCREAVLCHELLHVRRRDWPVILAEEVIRSLYWFHPAVWWLLSRIHLAREQAVDCEAVRITGNRQPYLDSLLTIARACVRPKAVPAPLFLRERHLVQRVGLLIKEVSMNKWRLIFSLAGIVVLLAGTVRLASGWFPMTGDPVLAQGQDAVPEVAGPKLPVLRVGSQVQDSKITHRVLPVYPEEAKALNLSTEVVMAVTINEEGLVYDVQILSGHPLLDQAATDAVRQWRYSPTLLNGQPVPVQANVSLRFSSETENVAPVLPKSAVSPASGQAGVVDRFNGSSPAMLGVVILHKHPEYGTIVMRMNRVDEDHASPSPFQMPVIAFDFEKLNALRQSTGLPQPGTTNPASYKFRLSEVSEISEIRHESGPAIPGMEEELARTHVVAPARFGSNPAAVWCILDFMPPTPSFNGPRQ